MDYGYGFDKLTTNIYNKVAIIVSIIIGLGSALSSKEDE